jgi:LacI family transcriptional regulator
VVSERGTGMLGMIVADIANPVFFGMIHGAERAASDRGLTMLMVETQVDGVILSASVRSGRPSPSCSLTHPSNRRPRPAGRQGRRGKSIDRLDSCRPF